MTWNNDHISWDPSEFCGISQLTIPRDMLWKPDLFIFELTEEDKSPMSPYLSIFYNGTVMLEDDSVVTSTCKMDVHKFPFDTQSCVITFGSIMHPVNELQLIPFSNSSRATQTSLEVIQTQGEWEFLSVSVMRSTGSFHRGEWDLLKYKITMKRRPLLYVVNFMLPVLFFLILDIASFFISDMNGEKLGFKVTVLLAISVLLLILNDILPSMSNKTPLIGTYCIVIFAFMLLSLLETILVIYLMEKDSVPDGQVDSVSQCVADGYEITPEDTCCEHESMDVKAVSEEQSGSGQQTDSKRMQLILAQLQELCQKLPSCAIGMGGRKPLYWKRTARRINAGFFCIYFVTTILFLLFIFIEWTT
ncbi:hypothetical protein SKAU_G00124890 [Synaphobranchus kaupii]|uniref:5-hydroxytryptamine receptor 3A n=1 Tax=Synaphobranchus kaupii TaxID=118154 RepID=A0A9Q1FPF8_SYNKA|nr:hypothetical protein SKAU_G00124890 [Synaphobranchus kaupii]